MKKKSMPTLKAASQQPADNDTSPGHVTAHEHHRSLVPRQLPPGSTTRSQTEGGPGRRTKADEHKKAPHSQASP